MSRLAVFFAPAETPKINGGRLLKRLRYRIFRINNLRRNPRDEDYMRRISDKVISKPFNMIDARYGLHRDHIQSANEIVLLWPDAIGAGWSDIEYKVFKYRSPGVQVWCLNGRRRYFQLTKFTLIGFRTRRMIERLWIGEIVFAVALIVVAPTLVVLDLIRGRN